MQTPLAFLTTKGSESKNSMLPARGTLIRRESKKATLATLLVRISQTLMLGGPGPVSGMHEYKCGLRWFEASLQGGCFLQGNMLHKQLQTNSMLRFDAYQFVFVFVLISNRKYFFILCTRTSSRPLSMKQADLEHVQLPRYHWCTSILTSLAHHFEEVDGKFMPGPSGQLI